MPSENIFTIALTDAERIKLAEAFGMLVQKLSNAKPVLEHPQPQTAARAAEPPVVASSASPSPLRDYWARDRKGKELPNPEGCMTVTVHLWKVEERKGPSGKPFARVTFDSTQGKGHVDANCFDMQLFPYLMRQNGKLTTMYLVKNGEYLNLVGVRA